jgi:chromosome segregation ATPase
MLEDRETCIRTLEAEMKVLDQEIIEGINTRKSLEARAEGLASELASYEQTTSKLIDQIERLNDINRESKEEFDRLLEERSSAFIQI